MQSGCMTMFFALAIVAMHMLVVSGRSRGVHGQPGAITRPSPTTYLPDRARSNSESQVSFKLYRQTPSTINSSIKFDVSQSTAPTPWSAATSTSPTSSTSTSMTTHNGTWTLNIDSGNKGVHIGSWTVDETYYGILSALRSLCGDAKPKKGAKHPKTKWGKDTCSSKDWGFYNEYADTHGNQLEAKDAAVVTIISSDIPEEYGNVLQDAFIEQIVDVLRLAVEDDKNCYMFDPKSTICLFCNDSLCHPIFGRYKSMTVNPQERLRRWCNVPDYVRVALADATGKERAHMRVDVRFDCPKTLGSSGCIMDMGRFDCVAVMGAAGSEARENGTRIGMLNSVVKGDVGIVAECPNKAVTGGCPNEKCLYQLGACF
jgi:hypothetical protein